MYIQVRVRYSRVPVPRRTYGVVMLADAVALLNLRTGTGTTSTKKHNSDLSAAAQQNNPELGSIDIDINFTLYKLI